eukprot:TRINITY_DN4899_c1_g1_i1.p1 TRINITY_DN4899_c1_g1~~TRINITY_DN4899_c1_g1_i1.p1  ORF type:complete len:151 (-),score=42.23 TRINITY_DN4899_c1_g1_i1:88-540(-)
MGESADTWSATDHMLGVAFDTWLTASELSTFHGPAVMTFEIRIIENETMFRPLASMDPAVFQGYTVIFSEPPGVSQPAPDDSGNGDDSAQDDVELYSEADEPPRPSRRQDTSSGSRSSGGKAKGKDKGKDKGKGKGGVIRPVKGKGKGVK